MLRHLLRYLKRHHVALLALFLASGGVSYAAVHLPPNSVGTNQLKNGAVTKRKVAKRMLKSLRGKRGPQGAQGPQGPEGPTMGAVGGNAAGPRAQPNRVWDELRPTIRRGGSLFVLGHVELATLTCGGTAPCSIDLGLYVDSHPVPHTGRTLASDCSTRPCKIRVRQQDLFGIVRGLAAGVHAVQLSSRTQTGSITGFSHRGGEVGLILLGN